MSQPEPEPKQREGEDQIHQLLKRRIITTMSIVVVTLTVVLTWALPPHNILEF
ncbi:hypothetical protein Scep_013090 [Stephania cephalantha]|uniref:Uncharacterized protein n=1 Tax=Stephania cephalantha TaxID=152367 RepID=A0AAP0JIL7_9MAGN